MSLLETLYECYSCHQRKPASEFWKVKSMKRGLNSYCKRCSTERYMRNQYPRLKTLESYRARHRASQQRYANKRPEVIKAQQEAQRHRTAIKRDACENCGASEVLLHMHHPDHARPLDVVTLCVPCHENAHHGGVA